MELPFPTRELPKCQPPLLRYSETQTLSVWCEFVLNYNSFFSYNSYNKFSAGSRFFFQFHFWFSFTCYSLKVDVAWVLLLNKVSFISEKSWFLSKKPWLHYLKQNRKKKTTTLKYHQVWKGFTQKIPLCEDSTFNKQRAVVVSPVLF